MLCGLAFTITALLHARAGHACAFSGTAAAVTNGIYVSYFVLFVRFALNAYRGSKPKRS